MNQHPVQVLDPVFDYLDGLIRDHGDTLFMVFTYVAMAAVLWVLGGGLRRELLNGEQMPHVPSVIVIHIPIGRPMPSPEPFNLFPPLCELPAGDPDDG